MLIHTVYFWLKDDLSADQRKSFVKAVKLLDGIDAISAAWLGTPAEIAPVPPSMPAMIMP